MTTYEPRAVALGYDRKPLQGKNSVISMKVIGIMVVKK